MKVSHKQKCYPSATISVPLPLALGETDGGDGVPILLLGQWSVELKGDKGMKRRIQSREKGRDLYHRRRVGMIGLEVDGDKMRWKKRAGNDMREDME